MKRNLSVYGTAVLVMACCSAHGVVTGNTPNYSVIAGRNIFDLRAPPPVEPAKAEPAPTPKLVLMGITTILGSKQALIKALPVPGSTAKEESWVLKEGQTAGGIEVLAIYDKTGSVRVNNSGREMTLTFDKDGPKMAEAVSTPVAGVAAGVRSLQLRNPRVAAPPLATPSAAASASSRPERPLSLEEQTVMMELQREAARNDPQAPPLPPTVLTPNAPTSQ